MGFSPSALSEQVSNCGGSKYCSLRSQHHDPHRTDGPWSIRFLGSKNHCGGSKPPPYGASSPNRIKPFWLGHGSAMPPSAGCHASLDNLKGISYIWMETFGQNPRSVRRPARTRKTSRRSGCVVQPDVGRFFLLWSLFSSIRGVRFNPIRFAQGQVEESDLRATFTNGLYV